MKLNRKGALATDLIVWVVLIFVMVVVVGMFVYLADTTKEKLLEQAPQIQKTLGDEGNATEIIENTFGAVPNSYNSLKWIMIMLIVGMAISIIVSGFLVNVHPVFFVMYVLIVIITIIISVPISNTYETLRLDPELGSTFSGFLGVSFIFSNLPIWVTVIGFTAGIVMYINMVRLRDQFG